VHHAETIDDHIGSPGVIDGLETAIDERLEPGAPMGTSELRDASSRVEPTGGGNPLHGVGRLGYERGRLGTQGLLGEGRVFDQLGQTARRTQPHLERIHGVWTRCIGRGKVVAGRLFTQVEHQMAGPAPASSAFGSHHYICFI
jgi:hypothetical protein